MKQEAFNQNQARWHNVSKCEFWQENELRSTMSLAIVMYLLTLSFFLMTVFWS